MKTHEATAQTIGEQLGWLIRNNSLKDGAVISEGCDLMDAVACAPIRTEADLLSVLSVAAALLELAPDIAGKHDTINASSIRVGFRCLESAVAHLEGKTGTAREAFIGTGVEAS